MTMFTLARDREVSGGGLRAEGDTVSRNGVKGVRDIGSGACSETITRNFRTVRNRSNMGPSHCTLVDLREESDSDMSCHFFFLALAVSSLLKETAAEAPMTACSCPNQIDLVFFFVALWSCLEMAV